MERVVLDKSRCGWWKSAVFYELYPKSFQDTTGSGTGDLRGILSHLDYLETLGVDAIWLCPICASPQVDNGYDISDFCAIEPSFGTMADMDELIAESKKRGIGILIDLTLNHCSDQHRWFRAAKSSRENPYHDYFLWRDGTPDCPPSGMRSVFGGSAWTYVPEIGQWYFHQFAPEQPDMNWENPKLRQELYDVMKFWVKKGVAGFRLDVIDQIAKEPDKDITINGPRLHEYLRGISENVLTDEGLVTVGEAWGADTERAKRYSAPDGSELSMVFQFEHIGLDQEPGKDKWDMIPLELPRLKECLRRWQQELYGCGWNSLFFNNHDLPRIVSRWGNDKEYRVESAKMLATMLYGLQGTPYIYQGEELGMTNIRLPLEQYQDLEIHNMYKERTERGDSPESVMQSIWARGRDNARTDAYWQQGWWKLLADVPGNTKVPVYIIDAWYDHHFGSAINTYASLAPETKEHSWLDIGCWNHMSQPCIAWGEQHNLENGDAHRMLEWFDLLLKQKKQPEKRVRTYVMREDRWKTLEAWPAPVSRTEKLYLGETTLNAEPAEGERTFVYDPETPVPSHGAESVLTTIAEAGSLLQPEPDYRPDVVSFVSAPLEKALPICGQIKVHLNVSTDVDDTAFTAKLMEVFPDGRAYNIRGGITTIAADLPEGQTYTPGQTAKVCVEMWDMNWTVQPGSCLRLDVSSSDFPQYAVHSNYAGVWSEQGKTRIAHQKILLGEGSFVELPLHEN